MEVVSTAAERELILDESWRFIGESPSEAALEAGYGRPVRSEEDQVLTAGMDPALLAARLESDVEFERRIDDLVEVPV